MDTIAQARADRLLVLLLYEYLLTWSEEMRHFWVNPRNWGRPKWNTIFFLLNRYVPLLGQTPLIGIFIGGMVERNDEQVCIPTGCFRVSSTFLLGLLFLDVGSLR
jgi:hypothetical protein